MDRMHEDDAGNRPVEPDHVEQAGDIEIDRRFGNACGNSRITGRPGRRPRPSAYPAGTAISRQTKTVMEAISPLVPRAATVSLVGLNTSPQYLNP